MFSCRHTVLFSFVIKPFIFWASLHIFSRVFKLSCWCYIDRPDPMVHLVFSKIAHRAAFLPHCPQKRWTPTAPPVDNRPPAGQTCVPALDWIRQTSAALFQGPCYRRFIMRELIKWLWIICHGGFKGMLFNGSDPLLQVKHRLIHFGINVCPLSVFCRLVSYKLPCSWTTLFMHDCIKSYFFQLYVII